MSKDFTLARIFTDHMVLQRNVEIPIWGKAEHGSHIKVEFCGFSKAVQAINGEWSTKLPPVTAGGPYELKATDGKDEIILKDILVGEVWIAGGQSNMEMRLGDINAKEEISCANIPKIRYYDVPRIHYESASLEYPEKYSEESEWKICTPENAGQFSAVAYYFAKNVQEALRVPFGIVNCSYGGTSASCWMNEKYLSEDPDVKTYLDEYNEILETLDLEKYEEEYKEEEKLRPDPKAPMNITVEAFETLMKNGPPMENVGPKSSNRPTGLYYNMLRKIIPYAVKGVIFYQGESDEIKPRIYSKLFGKLIQNWRDDWGNAQMPFLFVQLPAFGGIGYNPGGDTWAILREQQALVEETVPNTAMAVAFDCGDEKDPHPKNKKPVGERLSLLARAKIYGENIEYSGPVYQKMKNVGNLVVLTFGHVGKGLTATGESLRGFKISGYNKIFVDAKAEIKGDTVEVYNDEIKMPRAVRYGWANYMECNLYNKDGFPTRPFRTDIYC